MPLFILTNSLSKEGGRSQPGSQLLRGCARTSGPRAQLPSGIALHPQPPAAKAGAATAQHISPCCCHSQERAEGLQTQERAEGLQRSSTRGRDATGHSSRNLRQRCLPSPAPCSASPSLGAKCFSGLGVCLFPEDVWLKKGPGGEQTPSPQGAFCHLLLPGRPQSYTLGLARLMSMNAPYLAAPSSSKLFILSHSKPITNKIFDMTNVSLALREGLTESKAAN